MYHNYIYTCVMSIVRGRQNTTILIIFKEAGVLITPSFSESYTYHNHGEKRIGCPYHICKGNDGIWELKKYCPSLLCGISKNERGCFFNELRLSLLY